MSIKSWQIIAFSLVPLALVFVGVLGGAFRGTGASEQVFPTAVPTVEPTAGPTPTAQAGVTTIEIAAKDLEFNKRSLEAPANSEVLLRFDNQDNGVLHNVAIYTDQSASESIFVGELVAGPTVQEQTFTAPAAGNYYFRCDVHPQMNGTFIAR